jgi:hypothetical protein
VFFGFQRTKYLMAEKISLSSYVFIKISGI